MKLKPICGESAQVDQSVVEQWFKQIPSLIEGFDHKLVLNADETSFYYKAPRKRSYFPKDHDNHGCKTSKERVTILLCTSATGIKFKPVVVGKSKNPRCFKGVDTKSHGLHYFHSKNAWVTGKIFKKWLGRVDRFLKKRREKAIMFVDNFAGHKVAKKLRFLRVEYLPANTTSITQPLDGGIISAFKNINLSLLNQKMINDIENIDSSEVHLKSLSLLDAIKMLKELDLLSFGIVSSIERKSPL
jgi:hypothetical protein